VLRPFRHTGTLLGLQLMASTIKVVNIVTKELQVTLRQIKSAKSKASARPTKSETAKVNDLTEKAHDLKEKIDVLDERMDQIFKGCVNVMPFSPSQCHSTGRSLTLKPCGSACGYSGSSCTDTETSSLRSGPSV
jgi:hypothetical protein